MQIGIARATHQAAYPLLPALVSQQKIAVERRPPPSCPIAHVVDAYETNINHKVVWPSCFQIVPRRV